MRGWHRSAERVAAACWVLTAFWLVAAAGIAAWDWQDRWHSPAHAPSYFLKLWLFWASLAGPLLLIALLARLALTASWFARGVWVVMAVAIGAGCWGRLIEPELLRVRETSLRGAPAGAQPVRLALVSDLHWGLFGRDHQLQRLVDRINALQPDAVLVAGDWTYEPRRDLAAGLAPLARLTMPVFAVLGNHDLQAPGPRIAADLLAGLEQHRVQVIEGRSVRWRGWEIVGLDDAWGGHPQAQIRSLLRTPGANRLVLTHQPDTAQHMPRGAAFLTLAGHTHGGQIRLPWLTEAVLRGTTRNDWWDGLYSVPAGQLFVTPGIGMIGLPMRLAVPPTIDLLTLQR